MSDVIPTQPGDASHAVVMPWLVETGYTHAPDNRVIAGNDAMPTQTARQSVGVVLSQGFIADLRGKSSVSRLDEPLMCITAGGNHHALLSADAFMTYYYGTSDRADQLTEPLNTFTGNDRAGLAQGASEALTVDDLTFRMLRPHEIGKGMAFPGEYVVLGNQRDQVKQYGNAVTPPVMQMLIERGVETLL